MQELESAQRLIQNRISEIENEKIFERLQNLEKKQNELESSNFNLSREVKSLETSSKKSTLELLEDIAEIETKIDHTIPEIRREITKVEIDSAQLSSNQNILKEEDHNMARTIQALAVSISTLQNENSHQQSFDVELNRIKLEIEKLKSSARLRESFKKTVRINTETKYHSTSQCALIISTHRMCSYEFPKYYSLEIRFQPINNYCVLVKIYFNN